MRCATQQKADVNKQLHQLSIELSIVPNGHVVAKFFVVLDNLVVHGQLHGPRMFFTSSVNHWEVGRVAFIAGFTRRIPTVALVN